MMTVSLLLLLVTSLLLSYFDMRRVFSESLARRLQRGKALRLCSVIFIIALKVHRKVSLFTELLHNMKKK